MERNTARRDSFSPILHGPEYLTAMDIVIEELYDELDRIARHLLQDEQENSDEDDG